MTQCEGRGGWQHWFWSLFPLLWLAYLLYPVGAFLDQHHSLTETLLAAAGLAVFLALWVLVYYRSDRARGHLVRVLVACGWSALLYVVGLRLEGYTAVAFLIYAAGLIGFQPSPRVAALGTLAVTAGIFTPTWTGPGVSATDALTFAVFALVSAAGNHAGYRQHLYRAQLEQAQREKEKLVQAAERERIARDLHDLLGHTLSVIVLKSELAARLAERDPARAAAEIREVERISRDALSEVRSAVRGYQGSGLSAELGRSKVALDAAGVRLDYQGEALELPPAVEYAMEMVLREAVTNVVRHAHAANAVIRLGRVGRCYELEVRDDGVGGAAEAVPQPEGTGLTSMRERVRAQGGELTRRGGGGTSILARFPVDGPQALPQAVTA